MVAKTGTGQNVSTVITGAGSTAVSYSLPVAGGTGGVAWTVKPFADGFSWTEQSVTVTSSSVSGINFSSPTTVTADPPQQQQGSQNSLFNVNDNKSKVGLVLPAGALGSGTGNVTVTTKRNSGAPETANFKPLGGKSVEISIKREDGQGINNLQSGATISIDYSDLGSTLTLAQRQALQALIGLDAGTIQNRAGDIERRGQGAASAARPAVGLAPDEGHADERLVVHRAFQHQLVIAHVVAVIGGEDDDGVLGKAEVRRFARLHGIDAETTQLLVFLVEHHLTMSQIAQKQDLADPDTIAAFAKLIRTPHRLNALYLLTVADIRGTSPKVWNNWKARLLEELYQRTMGVLTTPRTRAGHAQFRPSWQEMNRRGLTLYTHPTVPTFAEDLIKGIPDTAIEINTDTTRSIADVIFSGTSGRSPNVNVIWSHGGGTLTHIIERFTRLALRPQFAALMPKGFMHEVQRFYYDIAQVAHPVPMAAMKTLYPLSHILFGTDYTFRTSAEMSAGLLQCKLSGKELRAIHRDNAAKLFPQFAKLPADK